MRPSFGDWESGGCALGVPNMPESLLAILLGLNSEVDSLSCDTAVCELRRRHLRTAGKSQIKIRTPFCRGP